MKWPHVLLLVFSGAILLAIVVLNQAGAIGWPFAAVWCGGVVAATHAVLYSLEDKP